MAQLLIKIVQKNEQIILALSLFQQKRAVGWE